MNNDIVVKQKPGVQPADPSLAVKQAPQAAEPPLELPTDKTIPEEPGAAPPVSKKSNKPVGVIATAVLVALCLVTVAVYIGYNQSQAI